MPEPLEKRVLRAMSEGLDSVIGLQVALAAPQAEVQRVVTMLTLAGLVADEQKPEGSRLALTDAGRQAAEQRSAFVFTATSTRHSGDIEEVGKLISAAWTLSRETRATSRARDDSGLLVSDAEREAAVAALSDAYAAGRLSDEELSQRTEHALAARTRGDVDAVLQGLGDRAGGAATADRRASARFVFALVAVLCVPFLVLALLLIAGGQQVALGAGLLLVLVPVLCWLGWVAVARRHE